MPVVRREPRRVAALLAVVGAMGALGCGGSGTTSTPTPPHETPATPTAVGTQPNPSYHRSPKKPRGSALDALAKLAVKGRAPKTGYSRDQFGDEWLSVG